MHIYYKIMQKNEYSSTYFLCTYLLSNLFHFISRITEINVHIIDMSMKSNKLSMLSPDKTAYYEQIK